jgi:hypothetical protein
MCVMMTYTNTHDRFGCDLTLKKQFIGSAVESLLISGQVY